MRSRATDEARGFRLPVSGHRSRPRVGPAAAGATALLTMVGVLAVPAGTASAEPKPSRKTLTARQAKLSDQAEQLTEQFNGLRDRLQRAQRAAKTAQANAVRQRKLLEDARVEVARMAADAFKNGSDDPVASFVASSDSQATLDRVATVDFFARQNSAQLTGLLQNMQAAERARKLADNSAAEVRTLTAQNKKRQQEVGKLLATVEKKLGVPARTTAAKAGPAPKVSARGASAKAMKAVQAALAVRGTPYSYGGGTASGPSFGIAQGSKIKGFDCSGLTLYAYAQVGITLPHYTGSQLTSGTRVSQSELKPGDLVFFYSDVHHMGLYIGGGNMVHAPQTGDVVKVAPISGRPFAGGVRVA